MSSTAKSLDSNEFREYFVESHGNHHVVKFKGKDGRDNKCGGFTDKKSALEAAAKMQLGIPVGIPVSFVHDSEITSL